MPKLGRRKLVGRADELGTLARLVGEGTRAVTLVGPPGVGKTRLALEAAASSERLTGRSSLWASLADHARPEDVVALVGGLLGTTTSAQDPAAYVGDILSRAGPLLLVLDDADAAQAGLGDLIEGWLRRAPNLSVLVTARSRVNMDDEQVISVPPLSVEAAVELFEHRARAARRASRSTTDPPEATRKLVELLDCLPLAIEFAAARAAVLPVQKLLARLESRVGDVLGGSPLATGRHGSLAAAIEVSWQLLGDNERRALAQCAAFAGSFTLEAAEAVLDGGTAVIDALITLHERSLLERFEEPSLDGEVRFQLYRSVRAFALERLSAAETDAAQARVDAAVAMEGERLARALTGPTARDAETRLELERTQLVVTHRRTIETAPAVCARAGLALSELSALRGVTSTTLAETTLRAARASGDPALLARSLVSFAITGARLGLVDEPRRALDEAASLAEAPEVLFARGRFHAQHGAFDEADADLARAASLVDTGADAHLAACIQNVQGCVAEIRGDLAAAVRAFEAARSGLRRCGGERMEAAVLNNLGVVRQAEGRLEDSRRLYEAALERATSSGNRIIEADARMNLGSWHLGEGDLEPAEQHSRAALVLQRRIGNRRFEGVAQANLALICHERGELREARALYQDALETLRACGEARFESMTLPFAAAAEAALGLLVEARADFAAASRFPTGMDPSPALVVSTLEAFLVLAEARDADEAAARDAQTRAVAKLEAATAAMVADRSAVRRPELSLAVRILSRALKGDPVAQRARAAEHVEGKALEVGSRQRWFQVRGAERVDLSRRGPLRLILRELLEHRRVAPGTGVSADALFNAGWRGQRALSHAAANRVYTAISTLRRLGLDAVLLRHDDGYLLDPAVRVVEVE